MLGAGTTSVARGANASTIDGARSRGDDRGHSWEARPRRGVDQDTGRRRSPRGGRVGLVKNVVEVIATVENVGDALAGETTTRFWVRSTEVDRELRVVHTPEIPPGDAIEVTALWDLRDGPGPYTITVTADAFSQINEVRKDNNVAVVHVRVRGTRAELE
jgi:hypothetical protein